MLSLCSFDRAQSYYLHCTCVFVCTVVSVSHMHLKVLVFMSVPSSEMCNIHLHICSFCLFIYLFFVRAVSRSWFSALVTGKALLVYIIIDINVPDNIYHHMHFSLPGNILQHHKLQPQKWSWINTSLKSQTKHYDLHNRQYIYIYIYQGHCVCTTVFWAWWSK